MPQHGPLHRDSVLTGSRLVGGTHGKSSDACSSPHLLSLEEAAPVPRK